MSKYISANRIVPKTMQPIQQRSTVKKVYTAEITLKPRRELGIGPIAQPSVMQTASSLQQAGYPVLPEKTSIQGIDVIPNLAVVVAYSGRDELRYHAALEATTRMRHASPRPALFILVEYVVDGEEPMFSEEGWDIVIHKTVLAGDKDIFQKEAMWNAGAQAAFDCNGITACVFADADTTWEDNSYLYYISNALKLYPVIQPYSGLYYSNQKDITGGYRGDKIYFSKAYALAHHMSNGTPGGAFACTREFFYDVMGGGWPVSSLGSGDVLFWRTYQGNGVLDTLPTNYDLSPADEKGMEPEIKVGYANLVMIHYYHGPMSNRMYTTRDYLVRKTAMKAGAELVHGDNVLGWCVDAESQLLKHSIAELKEMTKKAVEEGKQVPMSEVRKMFMELQQGPVEGPFIIVTCYRTGRGSRRRLEDFRNMVHQYCKDEHTLIIITDDRSVEARDHEQVQPFPFERYVCDKTWERMAVFSLTYPDWARIMYIDLSVDIVAPFHAPALQEGRFYMARSYGNTKKKDGIWDSSLMAFQWEHAWHRMYYKFWSLTTSRKRDNVGYQFLDPAEFINGFLTFNRCTYATNIISVLDYKYSDTKRDIPADMIIRP